MKSEKWWVIAVHQDYDKKSNLHSIKCYFYDDEKTAYDKVFNIPKGTDFKMFCEQDKALLYRIVTKKSEFGDCIPSPEESWTSYRKYWVVYYESTQENINEINIQVAFEKIKGLAEDIYKNPKIKNKKLKEGQNTLKELIEDNFQYRVY